MYFLAILIAYGLERRRGFFPGVQRDQWFFGFRDFCITVMTRLHLSPTWQGVLIIAMPCAALVALEHLVDGKLFGLPTLLLLVTTLVYSLGRGDIEAQVARYLTHWKSGDLQGAWHVAQDLSPDGKAIPADDAGQLQAEAGEALLHREFERWFCVVFWFALAGAWGALAYRLARLYGEQSDRVAGPDSLESFVKAVEWLPARLLALSFALVGNFSTTVACWREQLVAKGVSSARLMHRCALAALIGDQPPRNWGLSADDSRHAGGFGAGTEIESLHLLMRRTAIVWLVLLAIGILLVD